MTQCSLIACHHCDTLHERLPIPAGASANCARCGYVLYRQSRVGLQGWIALSVGAAVVLALACIFPIAHLSLKGMGVNAGLPHALYVTWEQGRLIVALMTGLFALAFPLGQVLFIYWALSAIARGRLPHDFKYGMRVLHVISAWSMVPVLLLAILVAFVKLLDLATIRIGAGLWGFAAATILLTVIGRVSAHRLWREAEDRGLVLKSGSTLQPGQLAVACHACGHVQPPGSRCQRCSARLHRRIPGSASRTWAYIIAATILYLPANILPVMVVRTPAGASEHTILSGVITFWKMGSWDLALIIFIASVVVPMTKLFALGVLLLRRSWQGEAVQRQRTRLYELVEFIGLWSMLDVFVVVLLSSMANFPGLSQIVAGPGALAFGVVVVLTMLAAMSFDPRLGWDAAPALAAGTGATRAASPVGQTQPATA